jgi:probable rRNA maturation factor
MQIDVASTVPGSPPPRHVRAVMTRIARAVRAKSRVRRPGSKEEISVMFCGDRKMRTLNRQYRRKDRPTDVLAFPGSSDGFLGDIVVSVPYAARQAKRRREPVSREIDRLLLHGFLHLLGYDHETDKGEMDLLESSLRRRLRLAEAA